MVVVVLPQALLHSADPVQESGLTRRLKNQMTLVGSKLMILVFAAATAAVVVLVVDVDGILVALLGAENYGRAVYSQSTDDSASLQWEA